MNDTDPVQARLVIAVTEITPLQRLWQEVLRHLQDRQAEIHAVFVTNDQWHRAASLPFTREISRISGRDTNFTPKRARQVHEERIELTRRRMLELAAEEKLSLHFEVLAETDQQRILDVVARPQNILIAPSFITRRPLFAALQNFGCRIVLIEAGENAEQDH